MTAPLIVGIGGTTRLASSGERIVRAVLSEAGALGAQICLFTGTDLAALPHYAPEQPERTAEQRAFVDTVRRADGLVIGTPGYHGGISGLVKNAIDLLEDLRTDTRPYLEGRPVGLVVVAAGWQACGVTLQALRGVVHALRGWPTPLGITVNIVDQHPFDADGRINDPRIREPVRAQAEQIVRFASRPTAN